MFYHGKSHGCGPRGIYAIWAHAANRSGGRGLRSERSGRRRMFDNGELRLVLLKLVSDQPRHGYDLIREIEALSGGAYAPSPGVVYPTLTLLQDMGLIDEAPAEGSRKLFDITEAGNAHLAEQADKVEAAMAKLFAMSKRHERTDGMQVRRAMGNLRAAVQIRLSHEEVSAETLHAVTALIDEAAQKIERL